MFGVRCLLGIVACYATVPLLGSAASAQVTNSKYGQADAFRQLEESLPTPNGHRTGSGRPGPNYRNPKINYKIAASLRERDANHAHPWIRGEETIQYRNHSQEPLEYLWLQLDANLLDPKSDRNLTATPPTTLPLSDPALTALKDRLSFPGGMKILKVTLDDRDVDDDIAVVKTMMRIPFAPGRPLPPGKRAEIHVEWEYQINDALKIPERSGYEVLPDGTYLFTIAQWYPRLVAFTDYTGWQHKQFLGRGEFTLELGDFDVKLRVPNNHIVAATGTLTNETDVLTGDQIKTLHDARANAAPIFANPSSSRAGSGKPQTHKPDVGHVTPDFVVDRSAADARRTEKSTGSKCWHYHANNVRDFAFASSPAFLWDVVGVRLKPDARDTTFTKPSDKKERVVLAMSFYPREAEGKWNLWSTYSTRAIVHTLGSYSNRTLPYPYEHAISVNGPVFGMEYPMICFNGPRPDRKDGTYTFETKADLISVVIHEVGHNWFPMIVNSDERQWTWMDEGLNTFLQYQAEQEWDDTDLHDGAQSESPENPAFVISRGQYPSQRGTPTDIIPYMQSREQVPIMTNSESVLQFGANAYAKPATALNILRESVMGPELFDFAFKEYAARWWFKRPMPADFFRTMEDASGVDLDWFWRGWFYTTDHVDVAIADVQEFSLTESSERAAASLSATRSAPPTATVPQAALTEQKPEVPKRHEQGTSTRLTESPAAPAALVAPQPAGEGVSAWRYYYAVKFTNAGGLITPLPVRLLDSAGNVIEEITIPAEIWRLNHREVTKLFFTSRQLSAVQFDPKHRTADVNPFNNTALLRDRDDTGPRALRSPNESRFERFLQQRGAPTLAPHKLGE